MNVGCDFKATGGSKAAARGTQDRSSSLRVFDRQWYPARLLRTLTQRPKLLRIEQLAMLRTEFERSSHRDALAEFVRVARLLILVAWQLQPNSAYIGHQINLAFKAFKQSIC